MVAYSNREIDVTDASPPRGKAVTIGLWVVTVIEGLMMALAGSSKFTAAAGWTANFVGWGYPAWFSYFTGGAEVLLAILLFVPRFAAWSGIALAVIMIGALGTLVIHDSPLGVTAPIVNLVLLGIVVIGRWPDRWRPGARPE